MKTNFKGTKLYWEQPSLALPFSVEKVSYLHESREQTLRVRAKLEVNVKPLQDLVFFRCESRG